MVPSEIIFNCYECLEISDNDFLRFLTTTLGDIESHSHSKGSFMARLRFNSTCVKLCHHPGFRNRNHPNLNQVNLLVTEELFQKIIDYVSK